MFDVLTIGSALVDIFISSKDFELQQAGDGVFLCQLYGAKIEVDSFDVCTGGGAGNVAVGLSRAGFSVATIAELGKDSLSKLVVDELRNDHVDTAYIIHERREQTGGSVILVGSDGGRTVMVHRGAASELDPTDISNRAFARASWVHLSSIAGRLPTLQEIGRQATEAEVRLSWNPGSAELALLAGGELAPGTLPCSLLVVNRQEWETIASLEATLVKTIPEIVITDGKLGLDLIANGERTHIEPSLVDTVVDETGAGDAFCAGYIAARLYHHPPEEACRWGVRNAGSVIQRFGAKAGLLRYEELAQAT